MYEKHGKTETKLYKTWFNMKHRCYYPKSSHFEKYGGRGITVCDEWRKSFSAFEAWALSNGYKEGLSLDRIDGNGNYEPNNCRWADMTTQIRNRSCTRRATINGETHTLKEWAEISGVNHNTIYTRYMRGDRGERLIR